VLEAQESFGGTWLTHRYPGHPLRQRPLHLRLPLQAVDGRADRDRRRDPQVHGRGDRRERPRRTSAIATTSPRRAGRAPTTCGRSRRRAPTPARRSRSPPTSCGCARATTGTPRATRRSGRAWTASRADRPSADLARGPRLRRQEGRRHRLGRDRGDADPGDRRRRARTSRCCSARRPSSAPAATRSRSPTTCASSRSTRTWIHEIVRRKILTIRPLHPPLVRRARGGARSCWRRFAAYLRARTTTWRRTSRRATGRGGSASPSCPTATCSRRSARGKASVVTDEIETFTETGIH
jgi:hypothetical protein